MANGRMISKKVDFLDLLFLNLSIDKASVVANAIGSRSVPDVSSNLVTL